MPRAGTVCWCSRGGEQDPSRAREFAIDRLPCRYMMGFIIFRGVLFGEKLTEQMSPRCRVTIPDPRFFSTPGRSSRDKTILDVFLIL